MSTLRIYTQRDFLLLWSGNVTSLVGFYGIRIAYPMLMLAVTGSAAAAGWIGFALSVPTLLFAMPVGVVADRYNTLRIIGACQIAGAAGTCMAIAVISTRLPHSGVILDIAAFIEGTAYVFIGVSEVGAVRDVVTPEQRSAAYSFVEAEQPIAILVGRAAGAAIYGVARWLPFAANAMSYAYCLLAVCLIRSKPAAPQSTTPGGRSAYREMVDGLRAVWTEPLLRASTAAIAISNVVIQIVLLLILVELKAAGQPPWAAGVVLAAAGVGGVLGATIATRLTERVPARFVYLGALWAWTLLLVPVALTTNPIVLAICWGGVGGVGVASNVALTVYQVGIIPEATLGRAIATMGLVCQAGVALGALAAGYLISAFGVMTTRWVVLAGMFILAVTAVTVAPSPARRDRTAVPT